MEKRALPAPQALLEALTHALGNQWAELLRLRQAVLERGEDEDIHDLRVASRRLRAALELAAPGIGQQKVRGLRWPVRELTRELGQLRNLDEARNYLPGLHDEGIAPLTATLEQRRRHEMHRIRHLLEDLPCKRLTRKLQQAVERLLLSGADHHHTVVGWLSDRNLTLYRSIHQLLQLPELAEHAEKRHRLRIAIKKWRYFNEMLALLCGRQPGQLVARLKHYQTLLGDLNDREVFQEMVQDAAALPVTVRQRVEVVISGQHRQLIEQFRQLMKQQPLQYQFMA